MSRRLGPGRLVASLSVVLAIGLATTVSPSQAGWSQATLQSTAPPSVRVYEVPTPSMSCSSNGVQITMSWNAVPDATSYTFYWLNGANSTTKSAGQLSHTWIPAFAVFSAWVVAHRNFGSVTWSSDESNHRSYYAVFGAAVCG